MAEKAISLTNVEPLNLVQLNQGYQPYQCGTPEPCPTEPRLSTLPMCKISAQCLIAPRL